MPSTSHERAQRICCWFGDIDSHGPEQTLRAQGFTEDRFVLRKPTPSHTMTYEQRELVAFLVEEWDYGFHHEEPRR